MMMTGQSTLNDSAMHRAVVYLKKSIHMNDIGHRLQEIKRFYEDTVSSFPPSTGA